MSGWPCLGGITRTTAGLAYWERDAAREVLFGTATALGLLRLLIQPLVDAADPLQMILEKTAGMVAEASKGGGQPGVVGGHAA